MKHKGEIIKMPSIRYKLISGMFKLIGVNKMLDKEGEEFENFLLTIRKSRKKHSKPKRAILYLFGGGYILPELFSTFI